MASRAVADTVKVWPGPRPVIAQVASLAVVGVEGQVRVPTPLLMVSVYCTLVVKLACLMTTVAVVGLVPTALTITGTLQNQCTGGLGTCVPVREQWLQIGQPMQAGNPLLRLPPVHPMDGSPGTWERW